MDWYYKMEGSSYTCTVEMIIPLLSQFIPEDVNFNKDFKHLVGKSNKDVVAICFKNCRMTNFPKMLTLWFPKLEKISISAVGLKEVTKDDLGVRES